MIQIRIGVFETNSSSTHTLCIMPAETYKKLSSGELYIQQWGDKVYTRDEAIDRAIEQNNRYDNRKITREMVEEMNYDEFHEFLSGCEIVNFDNWGSEYLDYFEEKYTTPSGDEIVVFGQYGYDG